MAMATLFDVPEMPDGCAAPIRLPSGNLVNSDRGMRPRRRAFGCVQSARFGPQACFGRIRGRACSILECQSSATCRHRLKKAPLLILPRFLDHLESLRRKVRDPTGQIALCGDKERGAASAPLLFRHHIGFVSGFIM